MDRKDASLYAICVLIWGTTWLAIKFQLGVVSPELSVAYRFFFASLILIAYCLLKKIPFPKKPAEHFQTAFQGVLLFALNYVIFYYSTKYLTSGLVSVIFSTFVGVNLINSRIFHKDPIEPRVALGAVLGLTGIALLFWQDLLAFESSSETLLGVGYGIIATYIASLGNMAAVRTKKMGISVLHANALGMFYGSSLIFLYAWIMGIPFVWDDRGSYLASMLYLSIFGSIFTFGAYLKLLNSIGPAKAAYTTVLFPIVALTLSTFFEDYVWTLPATIGVVVILFGNLVILTRKPKQSTQ